MPVELRLPVRGEEETGAQSLVAGYGSDTLQKPPTGRHYKDYREMRRHGTIALARMYLIAPVVAARWSIESRRGTPPDRVALVEAVMLDHRATLVQTAMEGTIDFGWQPFELVWHLADDDSVRLRKTKPLLQDITTILVDERGRFAGLRQRDKQGDNIDLDAEQCLNVAARVEGTNWHGEPLLENVRERYDEWSTCNKVAARYDDKVAGAVWVLKYPRASSRETPGGPLVDNAVIAEKILTQLRAGTGGIVIPTSVLDTMERVREGGEAGPGTWSLELVGDTGTRQASFIDRLGYLDVQIVRAMLSPERSVLEGQYGTKAEAGVHANLAVTARQLDHEFITRTVNWHVVDRMLAANFGEEARGTVKLVASPLADEQRAWLREVYKAVLTNPMSALEELDRLVDRDALRQAVGVPENPHTIKPERLRLIPETVDPDVETRTVAVPAEDVSAAITRVFAEAISHA